MCGGKNQLSHTKDVHKVEGEYKVTEKASFLGPVKVWQMFCHYRSWAGEAHSLLTLDCFLELCHIELILPIEMNVPSTVAVFILSIYLFAYVFIHFFIISLFVFGQCLYHSYLLLFCS